MWRNYLTVGFRALTKNRTYALINIIGLSIGLAACLILLLYVRYETSYDSWLPDADRVFQVQSINTSPENNDRRPQQGAHGVVAQSLAQFFPEIEAASRAEGQGLTVIKEGEAVSLEMLATEANFFDIIPLQFIRGNRQQALSDMNSVAISHSQAVDLFGTTDVVGRTVEGTSGGDPVAYRVSGVFEDLPRNSHMYFTMVRRITEQEKEDCAWQCINGSVYVKLRAGAHAQSITRRMQEWEKRGIPARDVAGQRISEGDIFDWRLVNVKDVHLSGADGPEERPVNDRRTVTTFAIIAVLILAMASINFINLATARAGQRAREVALRKVLGARRAQLIVQFLGESLLITALAMVIALALAELALPYIAQFLDLELKLDYFGKSGVILPVLGLLLVVGLAGGLYPAVYLSRFQPAAVLRANRSTAEPQGSGWLRNALVVTQFAISIGLIVCTATVYAQTRYLEHTDLGFRRDGLIEIAGANRDQVIPAREELMRRIAAVPGVDGVTAGGLWPAMGQILNTDVQVPGHAGMPMIGFYSVEPGFFSQLGIKLLAGRQMSKDRPNDSAEIPREPEAASEAAAKAIIERGVNVIVNQEAATRMGFKSPQDAVGKTVRINMYGSELGMTPATIVGVVANARFRSLRQQIEPTIFYDRGIYSRILVRYSSANPEQVRQSIAKVWRQILPDVPFTSNFADEQLAELYKADDARGKTFAGFALLAVLIACLGLFGLAAFTAERRTKEIGIRKVFGARSRDIVRLLAWQFSKPVILANIIAWPIAWWVMRDWLNGFDSRVDLGLTPFVTAGLLALLIALGTIVAHTLKVSRSNPIAALRYE